MERFKSQKFSIIPDGIIKSGQVSYRIDRQTGDINYEGEVVAGKWVFSKTIPLSGSAKVDPEILKVGQKRPGDVIVIGNLQCTILSVDPSGIATVRIIIQAEGVDLAGNLFLDFSGEYFEGKSATVRGQVQGYDVVLMLREVA